MRKPATSAVNMQFKLHPNFNPMHESYYKYRSTPQPPNPYHTEYSTVVPTSAQDSELASFSSGATRSDVASSIDDSIPSGRISKKDYRRQQQTIQHDLCSNEGIRAVPVNLSKNIPAPSTHLSKIPNPEKEFEAFAKVLDCQRGRT